MAESNAGSRDEKERIMNILFEVGRALENKKNFQFPANFSILALDDTAFTKAYFKQVGFSRSSCIMQGMQWFLNESDKQVLQEVKEYLNRTADDDNEEGNLPRRRPRQNQPPQNDQTDPANLQGNVEPPPVLAEHAHSNDQPNILELPVVMEQPMQPQNQENIEPPPVLAGNAQPNEQPDIAELPVFMEQPMHPQNGQPNAELLPVHVQPENAQIVIEHDPNQMVDNPPHQPQQQIEDQNLVADLMLDENIQQIFVDLNIVPPADNPPPPIDQIMGVVDQRPPVEGNDNQLPVDQVQLAIPDPIMDVPIENISNVPQPAQGDQNPPAQGQNENDNLNVAPAVRPVVNRPQNLNENEDALRPRRRLVTRRRVIQVNALEAVLVEEDNRFVRVKNRKEDIPMEIENQDESIEQPVRRGILESRRTRSADAPEQVVQDRSLQAAPEQVGAIANPVYGEILIREPVVDPNPVDQNVSLPALPDGGRASAANVPVGSTSNTEQQVIADVDIVPNDNIPIDEGVPLVSLPHDNVPLDQIPIANDPSENVLAPAPVDNVDLILQPEDRVRFRNGVDFLRILGRRHRSQLRNQVTLEQSDYDEYFNNLQPTATTDLLERVTSAVNVLPESHQLAVLLSERNIVRMDQIRIDGNGFSVQEQRLKQLIALTQLASAGIIIINRNENNEPVSIQLAEIVEYHFDFDGGAPEDSDESSDEQVAEREDDDGSDEDEVIDFNYDTGSEGTVVEVETDADSAGSPDY